MTRALQNQTLEQRLHFIDLFMAIQLSIYNLRTKQKDIRYIYDEQQNIEIFNAQRALTIEISCKAFDIVLTEKV